MNTLPVHITNQETGLTELGNYQHLIEEFQLDNQASSVSVRTYGRQLKNFFVWLQLNGYELSTVGMRDIMAYKNYVVERYADSTAYGYVLAVKMFFEWTDARQFYPNVAKPVRLPAVDNNYRKLPFTHTQIQDMLNLFNTSTVQGARNRAIILTLATTGLRTHELASAKIGDISVAYDAQVLKVKGKGRSSKNDYVILDGATLQAIEHYFTVRSEATYERLERGITQDDYLFASSGNKNFNGKIDTSVIRRLVGNCKKKLGINNKDLTAHSFRHYFATECLRETKNELFVQSQLRHKGLTHIPRYTAMIAQQERIRMASSIGEKFQ